jgi:putative transcriptional regulator
MTGRRPSAFDSMSGSLTGLALIAMPGIGDPRFERAVIYICGHTAEHAYGLVLNRPVDGLTTPSLLQKLGVESAIEVPPDPVLYGGPVEKERGFVLHTADYLNSESSTLIDAGVALTGTRDVLEAMASHNRRPRHAFLALGYSGWGAGQLEQELQQNVWLTCDPDEAILFGHDYDHKWSMALNLLGIEAHQLSADAGRA